MTTGEVALWAAIYLIVAPLIWRRCRSQPITARLSWLALWSFAGVMGTTAMLFACVATHYEHVPGSDGYCASTPAANIAFFAYLALTGGFIGAAVIQRAGIRSSPIGQHR